MQLISRNGRYALEKVLADAKRNLLICTPFITATEMARVIKTLQQKADYRRLAVHLVTDLRPDNILAGSLDIRALLELFDSGCIVNLTALARLHAKVYLADTQTAWVTSANLTTNALNYNFEYGVLIEEPVTATNILNDINEYAKLGATATEAQVKNYAVAVEALRQEYDVQQRVSRQRIRQQFQEQYEQVTVEALRLQVGSRSPHAIFAEAIVYLLRSGPMSTDAMQSLVQELLPDLCDDQHDRIIDGRHFGKLWKHHVRSAQQHLKRAGIITYEQGVWRLTSR